MPNLLQRLALFCVFVLLFAVAAAAQDISLRVEAFRLMQRANTVSRPSHRTRNHSEAVTFRAYRLDGSTVEGQVNNIIAGDIERYELTMGEYHGISIHFPDRIVQNDYQPSPPEMLELEELTPILLGNFDKSDTINSITPATLLGRPAHCVQFETTNGRTHQPANEICFDDEQGTLLRWNVGKELIEDSDYVSFENVLMPRTIRHYINNQLRMEVHQEFSVIEDPIDWNALTPEHAHTLTTCYDYKQPVIQWMPQPAGAGPGPWYDVKVHGALWRDGRVHQGTVLPAGRPALEKQALDLVATWVFTPAMCNGKPTTIGVDFVVHFPPQ